MKKRYQHLLKSIVFSCLALFVMAILPSKQVSADGWGKHGENINWYFHENTGYLEITGSGEMPDKTPDWKSYKDSIKKVSAGKKSFKVYWKKQYPQVNGYQIQYSTSKSFRSKKTITVGSYRSSNKTIKKLAKKRKYYSSWSSIKSVKTK